MRGRRHAGAQTSLAPLQQPSEHGVRDVAGVDRMFALASRARERGRVGRDDQPAAAVGLAQGAYLRVTAWADLVPAGPIEALSHSRAPSLVSWAE